MTNYDQPAVLNDSKPDKLDIVRPLLLCRPQLAKGENFTAYLTRLSQANRLTGIRALAKLLKVSCGQLMTMSPTALELLMRGNRTLADAHCRLYDQQPEVVRRRPDRSERTRICPQCFSEGNPHLLLWDRPFTIVCEIHRLCLIDRCPACQKSITHLRQNTYTCACGMDWRTYKQAAEPEWLPQFYNVFAPWRLDALLDPRDFVEHEQRSLVILLNFLVPVTDRMRPGDRRGRIESKAKLDFSRLVEVEALSNDWPSSLQKRVLEMHATSRASVVKLISRINGLALTELRTAIKSALARRRHETRLSLLAKKSPEPQGPITTVSELIKLTGLTTKTVLRAIEFGIIKCEKARRNKSDAKQKIELSLSDSKRLRALHRCSVTFREATQRLGCGSCHLGLFVVSNCLPVTRFTARTFGWRFRIRDLDRLVVRMEVLAIPIERTREEMIRFTALTMRGISAFPTDAWKCWFDEVLIGRVKLYRVGPGNKSLDALYVLRDELPRRRQRPRQRNEKLTDD